MRTFFKYLFAASFLAMLLNFGDVLIGSRAILDTPRVHVVQEGEYFSQLAEHYYGNPAYWRALALVNRAPDVDRIYPGERVVLPDAGTIARISRARRLTEVNKMVDSQLAVADAETPAQAEEFARPAVAFDGLPEPSGTAVSSEQQVEQQNSAPAAAEIPAGTVVPADPAPEATDRQPELREGQSPEDSGAQFAEKDGNAAMIALAEEPGVATKTDGWHLPAAIGAGAAFLMLAFVIHRRRKKAEPEPEIDASPIKSFVLDEDDKIAPTEDELKEISEEFFKPVKRKEPAATPAATPK